MIDNLHVYIDCYKILLHEKSKNYELFEFQDDQYLFDKFINPK